MDRSEAVTAILVAAEQLLRTVDLPRQTGTPTLAIPVGVVQQLASAVATYHGAETVPVRPGFCQADPECPWQADLPSHTCYRHSQWAALPSTRVMRAAVFEDGEAE